jgi:hypothetical protein
MPPRPTSESAIPVGAINQLFEMSITSHHQCFACLLASIPKCCCCSSSYQEKIHHHIPGSFSLSFSLSLLTLAAFTTNSLTTSKQSDNNPHFLQHKEGVPNQTQKFTLKNEEETETLASARMHCMQVPCSWRS